MNKAFKYIACCLVGVFTLLPMQAQNIIRPKIAGPGNLWVNSYNGVLFFEQKDFETQNSAMPMQLCFYYNSSACSIDYGYGLGFSLGFEMRYREDVIGGVDIESGDGRIDHFAKYGDEYKAPAGVFSKLVRPTFDTYLLTTKDGTKYFFDNAHHHKVTAIEDRNGNITTFKYQDTLLVEIKDAVGHTITLDYTDGLLVKASSTFSSGNFKYEYDGLRRLRKRIDPLGNVTLYGYSRQNRLDEITDANGFKTLIAYNNTGMVSRLKTDVSDKSIRYDGDKTVFIDYTEPNNVYSYYKWDEKGRAIEKVGLCCGIQSTLKYDDYDNVAQLIDANGNATIFTYDELGNMLTLRDPKGFTEQYTYEPSCNQVASFRDKNGNTYSFSYDSKGNLTALSGPLGFKNLYSYDEHGWLTMITDSKGSVTRTTYNSDGTKASVVNADGGVVNFIYDSYGRMISLTDPMGNTTSYTYDDLGRIIKEINALGNATTKTYDKVGNIARVLDASGNITAYTYDELGHITSMTDPSGNLYSFEYDGRGNIITYIDPLGIRQQLTYNDRNKIESYTNGAGEKANYDYDIKGNLISAMLPNGNVIIYDYDELDNLTEISDNMGLIAIYEYDGNGNRTSESDGLNRKITYNYDALNRMISELDPSGNKKLYDYDANGNLISIADEKGNTTSYSYDVMNRQVSFTDELSAKTLFFYDMNSNLTRITDAKGNATTYSYDALNNKTVATFANGVSLQYSYDKLGRVNIVKDRASNEFIYEYDERGNLISRHYPDGSIDKYSYDANSRMISAINNEATVTFSYDNAGRVTRESLNGQSTTYSYDIAAGKRSLIYPSGLIKVECLNARNLITNIIQNGKEVVAISYNSSGQKISQSFANGISTEFEYNLNGLLTSIKDNNSILNISMSYDALKNLIKLEDKIDSKRTENYGYDLVSQLVSFKKGESQKFWEYDLLKNRTRTINNGIETIYHSNNVNAYSAIYGENNSMLAYDSNGNMIADGYHQYQYDYNNRLIGISDVNKRFKYDALGRRICNDNILYYYNGDQMIEEVNNNTTTSYLYGSHLDELLLINRDDMQYYYHANHLGSTLAITDNIGNLVERIEYDPFGAPAFYDSSGNTVNRSITENSILFCGREYDIESGNYHMRMRTFNPSLGRFLQHDPLGYIDGMNDYQYTNNRVVIFRDPYGLACDIDNSPKSNFCNEHPVVCDLLQLGLGAASSAPGPYGPLANAASIGLGNHQLDGDLQNEDYGKAIMDGLGMVATGVGIGAALVEAPAVATGAGIVGLGLGIGSFLHDYNPPGPYDNYTQDEMIQMQQAMNGYNDFVSGAWGH